MIIAIDIGGTKTLVAVCKTDGTIVAEQRFETPKEYKNFLAQLKNAFSQLPLKDCSLTVVAAPGKINRQNGTVVEFGNLPWKNVPLKKDVSALSKTDVLLENDANLAGLSEAHNLKPQPHRVLYITFSTGIGTGLVTDGSLDPEFLDSEGGHMLFEHDGKLQMWEKFASGKAIVATYGKRASELNDPKAWQQIAKWFALGIVDLTAVLEPDIIVIGGGVGSHFAKFGSFLQAEVNNLTPPLVNKPPIVPAKAAEQAVVYGCVVLANQYEQHR